MATKFVRVRDKSTGVEVSVSAARAKTLAARGAEILDVPAVDRLGRPLPASKASKKETVK